MNTSELRSFFFHCIVARLNNVLYADGGNAPYTMFDVNIEFMLGFQVRPQFRHNYERNKFLHNRDRYLIAYLNGNKYILLRQKKNEEITVYSKVVEKLFPDNSNALTVLKESLGKFYKKVSVEEKSDVRDYDESERSIHESRNRANEV